MRNMQTLRLLASVTAAACCALALLATSCLGPTVVAWRGIVHFNQQEATTEGRTVTTPTNSSGSVEAAKTNDFKTDINQKDTP